MIFFLNETIRQKVEAFPGYYLSDSAKHSRGTAQGVLD